MPTFELAFLGHFVRIYFVFCNEMLLKKKRTIMKMRNKHRKCTIFMIIVVFLKGNVVLSNFDYHFQVFSKNAKIEESSPNCSPTTALSGKVFSHLPS